MYLQKVLSRKTVLKILVFCCSLEVMTKIAGSGSASGSISQRHGSADPDPHQNVIDPEHCHKHRKKYLEPRFRPPPFPAAIQLKYREGTLLNTIGPTKTHV
jgi:hypothetical protein